MPSKESGRREIVVLQPAMGSYRQAFLDELQGRSDLVFLVGDRHFVPTVVTGVQSPLVQRTGSNVYKAGRRVGWQRNVTRRALKSRVLIAELNPRNVNTWALLIVRRLMGRPTVLWGHAWPRNGQGSKSDRIRGLLRRLASGVLVYTASDRRALGKADPRLRVWVAPNALYRKNDLQYGTATAAAAPPPSFVWIGRFVGEKQPALALTAFASLAASTDEQVHLTMIGDGPLRADMEKLAEELGVSQTVQFTGWIDSPEVLRPIFSQALATVSSGYVGLNVTQSLGFGCPVIWPEGAHNAPEVTILDDTNSVSFNHGNKDDLIFAMRQAMHTSFDRVSMSSHIRDTYSVEAMANGFIQCIEEVVP